MTNLQGFSHYGGLLRSLPGQSPRIRNYYRMQTLVFAVIIVFGFELGSKISRLGGLVFKAFAGVAAYRCSYRDSYRVGGVGCS